MSLFRRGFDRLLGRGLSSQGREFIFMEIQSRALKFVGFILLSLIAAIIEMTGVGLVFPLLVIIMDPSSIDRFRLLSWLTDDVGLGRGTGLSVFIVGLIGVLMVGKNAYMIFFNWLQMHSLANWKTALSTRLMRTYLFSDYSVHLAKTSSEIIRNIALTAAVYDQFVTALINLIVNGVVLLALCALLVLALPPETLLGLAIIGLFSFVLYASMRRPFSEIGSELNDLFRKRQAILRQSIGMIKETKLMAKEYFFLDAFWKVERRNFSRQAHYNFMSTMPPLATEGAVILAILGIVSYILFLSDQQHTGVALLGLLAATLFRLTPVINRILSALQLMNISQNSVDLIGKDIAELEVAAYKPDVEPEPLPFSRSVKFDRVGFNYPGSSKPAVDGITFEIHKNEMIGITGPSGGGKSTLAGLLMGLIQPTSGEIRIDDVPLVGSPRLRAWHKHIGYVPQSVFLIEDSIARNVAFAADEIDEKRVWEVLEIVQLRSFVEGLPKGIHEFIGEDGSKLSGGQRQRLGIARVLYEDPEFLVFDEATSALDAAVERAFTESLMQLRRSRTLFIIAHRLSTLRDCDRIIMLDEGRILDAAPFDELEARCSPFKKLVAISRLDRVTE